MVRWALVGAALLVLPGCPGTTSTPPARDAGYSPPDLWPAFDGGAPQDRGWSDRSVLEAGADLPPVGDLGNVSQILLVALDQAQTGNLGGVQGADAKCQAQAQGAGLPGVFRAFLSSSSQDVKDLIGGPNMSLPVVNTQGQALFPSWSAVFTTQEWASGVELYNFAGAKVEDNTGGITDGDLWHGSKPDGTAAPDTCSDWTSASSAVQGQNGEADQHELLRQETQDCDNTFGVVCVRLAP